MNDEKTCWECVHQSVCKVFSEVNHVVNRVPCSLIVNIQFPATLANMCKEYMKRKCDVNDS